MAVSVTYNNWTTSSDFKQYIYVYGGGSFSANLATETSFDYFPDDVAVNDAIYFGSLYWPFKDVKIYVGTVFVATSVTFTWEYFNGSSWVALSSVTNSNAFESSGEQIVTWDFPGMTNWKNTLVNGQRALWIRTRISAIDTPSEGGAQSTKVVEVGDHTITVSGGTVETPANIGNIQSADDSNGWGLCTTAGNAINIDSHLSLEDYFSISRGYIRTNYGRLITASDSNITITQSTIVINAPRMGGNFSSNVFMGTVDVTDSHISRSADRLSISCDGTHQRSHFASGGDITFNNADLEIIDCYYAAVSVIGMQVSFTTPPEGLSSANQVNTTTSISLYGGNYPSFSQSGYTGRTANLINPETEPTLVITRGEHYIYIKYSFDLKIVDNNGDGISGVIVVINDKDGTEVFSGSTDSSGDIVQQELVYRQYDSEGASAGQSNPPINNVIKTPHTVTISKPGYQTKTLKLTMDRKREEVEVLEKVKDYNFSKKGRLITQ